MRNRWNIDHLKLLSLAAWGYLTFGLGYLATFLHTFAGYDISNKPSDWTDFAGMLGGLIGPPVAFWSIALVLKSVRDQQAQAKSQIQQWEEQRNREDAMLDPEILRVEACKDNWHNDGESFLLHVAGSARWSMSTAGPGKSNAAIIGQPTSRLLLQVILWKRDGENAIYEGFLQFYRSNGTTGWYLVSVDASEFGTAGFGFGVRRVTRGEAHS